MRLVIMGASTYFLANFPAKLHENKRKFNPEGGARPGFYYVDPPLKIVFLQILPVPFSQSKPLASVSDGENSLFERETQCGKVQFFSISCMAKK